MSEAARKAANRLAQDFPLGLTQGLDAALLKIRSPDIYQVYASYVDRSFDPGTLLRVSRGAIRGDQYCRRRFASLSKDPILRLARSMAVGGDESAIANSLTLFEAVGSVFGLAALPKRFRLIYADVVAYKRRHDLLEQLLNETEFEVHERLRLQLEVSNPFTRKASNSEDEAKWLEDFNRFLNQSGTLSEVSLMPRAEGEPFQRLTAAARTGSTLTGPLVTVIMSTFQRDTMMIHAIESILRQTWSNLELIVVDDNSGSAYTGVLDQIESLDDRIRLVRKSVNEGTYLARNTALNIARGDFVTFQDSDDWSHPERIERQVRHLLAHPEAPANQSLCVRISENFETVKIGYPPMRRNESSLLFRRQIIKRVGYFDQSRKGADSEYRKRIEAAYDKTDIPVIGPDALSVIRLTSGSLSRSELTVGYQHPSRYLYAEGARLKHQAMVASSSFFVSPSSTAGPLTVGAFRPDHSAPPTAGSGVLYLGDLRVGSSSSETLIQSVLQNSTQSEQPAYISHVIGVVNHHSAKEAIDPRVIQLLDSGLAKLCALNEPAVFHTIVVTDPSLMQYRPWGGSRVRAEKGLVLGAKPTASRVETAWDATTVETNILELFGADPIWNEASGALSRRSPLFSQGRSKSLLDGVTTMHVPKAGFVQAWHSPASPEPLHSNSTRSAVFRRLGTGAHSKVPTWSGIFGATRIELSGYPLPGPKLSSDAEGIALQLAKALSSGQREFLSLVATLGGHWLVIAHHDGEVYWSSNGVSVRLLGSSGGVDIHARVDGSRLTSQAVLHAYNETQEHQVRPTPTQTSNPEVSMTSAASELQLLAHTNISQLSRYGRPVLLLDDSIDSFRLLGILRFNLDRVQIYVTGSASKMSRFLDKKLVPHSQLRGSLLVNQDWVLETRLGLRQANSQRPDSRFSLLSSPHAVNLITSLTSDGFEAELDQLWPGLAKAYTS